MLQVDWDATFVRGDNERLVWRQFTAADDKAIQKAIDDYVESMGLNGWELKTALIVGRRRINKP